MIKLDQVNIQVEKLSSDQLWIYFNNAKIFSDITLQEERINKLSAMASFITIRHNRQIIALVGFYMNKKPLCYITHLSVLPLYKRQGLATEMFNFLERQAKNKGFNIVKLEVAKNNFPALKLYNNLGYIILTDSERGNYYMEKIL